MLPYYSRISDALKIPVEAIQNFDEEQAMNLKLHEEKIALYEKMLKEKDEMMARLEKLIEGK